MNNHILNTGIDLTLANTSINPDNVHGIIGKYMLTDGFGFVIDLGNSHGANIIDAKNGSVYIDFFTFFG